MKISAPKENYVFIELTSEDMKKLNITYDEMDYSNVETRRIIATVLDEARSALGNRFEISREVKIEALPSIDGGCLLFFSVSRKPLHYKVKSRSARVAYRFDNIDDVFDLSHIAAKINTKSVKSSLFFSSGEYFMTLEGRLHRSLLALLGEFSKPSAHTEKEIKELESSCSCLIRDNALDRLSLVS